MKYRVAHSTSVRVGKTVHDFPRGEVIPATRIPKEAPLDEWIASGHFVPVKEGKR